MIYGRVWKFGNDIDTDAIIPGCYLDNYSPEHLARHVMEGIDADFHFKVSEGDFIVAGKHFGIGSSREQAAIALKAAGIKVLLAESFARIFYRNAINQGLLPLVCPNCSNVFITGEKICVDLERGIVSSSDEPRKILDFQQLTPAIARIFEAGGLINLLRSEIQGSSEN